MPVSSADNKEVDAKAIGYVLGLTSLLVVGLTGRAREADSAPKPAAVSPASTGRKLIRRFDFDERRLGNFESLPMHWYIMGRPPQTADPAFQRQPLHQRLLEKPGFPIYGDVRFDTRHAVSGRHSFYLGVHGGNAGAFTELGTLPAIPGGSYLVTAKARTSGLNQAAARIVAYFADARGRAIASSRTRSKPLRHLDHWTSVGIKLPRPASSDAAWLMLQLEVDQPRPSRDNPLASQQIVLQDVQGGAWFDDLAVWQLPRVRLTTQSRVNIVRGAEGPRFSVDLHDLSGRPAKAVLTVYNLHGQPVAQGERLVRRAASWSWTPSLPAYGWYRGELRLLSLPGATNVTASRASGEGGRGRPRGDGSSAHASGSASGQARPYADAHATNKDESVAEASRTVLWLPRRLVGSTRDRGRFVLDATGLAEPQLELLPRIMKEAGLIPSAAEGRGGGLGGAIVSAWSAGTTLKTLGKREALLNGIIGSLVGRQDDTKREEGRRPGGVMISFNPLPRAVADRLGVKPTRPAAALGSDGSAWKRYVAPMLIREGGRVDAWWLGRPGRSESTGSLEKPSAPASDRAPGGARRTPGASQQKFSEAARDKQDGNGGESHSRGQTAGNLRQRLSSLTSDPQIVTPWPWESMATGPSAGESTAGAEAGGRAETDMTATNGTPTSLPEGVTAAVAVPAELNAMRMRQRLQALGDGALSSVWLYLPGSSSAPPSRATPTSPDDARELAVKMVEGWAAGVRGLVLAHGWAAARRQPNRPMSHSTSTENSSPHPNAKTPSRGQAMAAPDPRLGVFTNVAHALAGRRLLGRLPLPHGAQGLIFGERGQAGNHNGASTRSRRGMLVVWQPPTPPPPSTPTTADAGGTASKSPAGHSRPTGGGRAKTLAMRLGGQPLATDIWGNRTPVPISEGRAQLPLTPAPVFITDIDTNLALFRGRFRLDKPFIQSKQRPHHRKVILHNPWSHTLNGKLRFTGPRGWSIKPTTRKFSIPAGEDWRLSVKITFPYGESAGAKRLSARVKLSGEPGGKPQRSLNLSTPITLGLRDLDFLPTVRIMSATRAGGRGKKSRDSGTGAGSEQVSVQVTCRVTNRDDHPRSFSIYASLPGHPRQQHAVPRLAPHQSVTPRFIFKNVSSSIDPPVVRAGIRDLHGPTVFNRRLPLKRPDR